MLLIEGEKEDWILIEIYGPTETLEQIFFIYLLLFFFGVVVVVDKFGVDHIFEIHLILFQYNIANRKNFGTKTLLLGWTRSNKLGDHQKTQREQRRRVKNISIWVSTKD